MNQKKIEEEFKDIKKTLIGLKWNSDVWAIIGAMCFFFAYGYYKFFGMNIYVKLFLIMGWFLMVGITWIFYYLEKKELSKLEESK